MCKIIEKYSKRAKKMKKCAKRKKPPLSKGGGRRRRTEGFRRALPGCPSHLRTARNPSASLRSAPPFDKGGFWRRGRACPARSFAAGTPFKGSRARPRNKKSGCPTHPCVKHPPDPKIIFSFSPQPRPRPCSPLRRPARGRAPDKTPDTTSAQNTAIQRAGCRRRSA